MNSSPPKSSSSSTARRLAAAAAAAALTLTGLAATAPTASAGTAKARYTNATWLTGDCQAHLNYPKAGVDPRGPVLRQTRADGQRTAVGVRYTYYDKAMVLDYANSGSFPHWIWVPRSCLVDPVARNFDEQALADGRAQDLRSRPDGSSYSTPLPELRAVGGDGNNTTVDVTPAHPRPAIKTIHLTKNATLRSGPMKFVTGNLVPTQELRITTSKCRRSDGSPYGAQQWVFGYSPDAQRWGYVQARALPACL